MDAQIDSQKVADYYNKLSSIWPQNEPWYRHTQKEISRFIHDHPFEKNDYVLNAGAGENDYNIQGRIHYVDIAEKKIQDKPLFTVANIEKLPFENDLFTGVVCVGSVLNYCDAVAALSELSRVLCRSGKLILEFESSYSYEYKGTPLYGVDADVVTTTYYGQPHKIWVFSPAYIKRVLNHCNLKLLNEEYFHIISALAFHLGKSETDSSRYTCLDTIAKRIPFVKRHGCNVLMECVKL